MTIRQPAVAGQFYPERISDLEHSVDNLLAQARPAALAAAGPAPKALIVPHAGYIYSGLTAAFAYAMLEPLRAQIKRVVLLGPAHYVAFSGVATTPSEAFATPLGKVPLDQAAASSLMALPQVVESAQAHAPEHSLEVQLPFLQRVLDDFTLVPLVVGDSTTHEVAAVIEACWGGPETLILISSDLSHYLPYDTAQAMDADTVRRILDLNWPLPDRTACGARGVNAMIVAAKFHGLTPRLIDFRNSGDTAGSRDRVVGYASIAFAEAAPPADELFDDEDADEDQEQADDGVPPAAPAVPRRAGG